MKSIAYVISFIIIVGGLVAIQYFISPPQLSEISKEEKIENSENPIAENNSQNLKKNPIGLLFSKEIFEKSGLTNIEVGESKEINHLFHLFPIDSEIDNFRVIETEYFQKNEVSEEKEGENKKVLVIYTIFSTTPRSTLKAYSDIKKQLIRSFENDIEKKIIEANQYGDKSFVISLESNQKTMYILIAYRDRLLGFEYPIGKTFSRHEEMKKFLTFIFSPQP